MTPDLKVTMRNNTYINSNLDQLTKFSCSSRSTKLKDILPWYISQMIKRIVLISMRIVISCDMKMDIPSLTES